MRSVVIHFKELSLKGRNRPWFVQLLVRNVRRALDGCDVRDVRSLMGRVEVTLGEDVPWDEVRERLRRVFGVANFSLAGRSAIDFDVLARALVAMAGARQPSSFRVVARRTDKRYPLESPVVEREIGARVATATGWSVNLAAPALRLHVDLLPEHAFYYIDKEPGAGGLPWGASGRVTCLLSGGIDSPVAAWRMMRRGCEVSFVHFHSYPVQSLASQEKARALVDRLSLWQGETRLALVPFGALQQQVVVSVPQELRVVIYRRLMLRIAEQLARRWKSRALVTGEAIGQVASQTLENLTLIASAARMEVLRPLVAMDKDEIMQTAESIGTLSTSQLPDEDCCTLFTPRYPATRARLVDVGEAESRLPVDDMVRAAVQATVVELRERRAGAAVGVHTARQAP